MYQIIHSCKFNHFSMAINCVVAKTGNVFPIVWEFATPKYSFCGPWLSECRIITQRVNDYSPV
jgi:hypothetical protein